LQLGVSPLDMLLAAVGSSADPSSGGRQMPSHWGSADLHIVSGSSPTGTQVLHGVGAGDASLVYERVAEIPDRERFFHPDEVIFVSLGDGATSEGEFWEALNWTCLRRLPVLFLIEDNGYAISVPVEFQTAGGDISRLVRSFPNLHVDSIDGTDFPQSLRAMREAVAGVRARRGPAFVHAHCIRPYSHSLSDDERLYKTPDEREAEARRDPIARLAALLKSERLATADDLAALADEVQREIDRAALEALHAPQPPKDTAAAWLYSPDVDVTSSAFETPEQPDGAPDTMVGVINRTLTDEMARNPRIIVFGEDVADASRTEALPLVSGKGGVFKLTHGLQRLYGDDRVFNSSLAEASITGRAVGIAVRKLKPVVEIQFFDYVWPAMMQIRDEMTMLRYRSANSFSCPLVMRVPIGGYLRGGGPYHSQSGESIFAHCPGLRIAFPSNARDAAGLLRTAIRCDDPVLFLEHKHLYRQTYNKSAYPGADFMIPFGKAKLVHEGSDVLLVTWGALVHRSIVAAHQAEKEGVSTAVLDLRTIAPYDWDTIAAIVKRTNRIVVAHEDQLTCGFGAEIAARVAGELFHFLDAPVRRVGALDVPVAYNPDLEDEILPQIPDLLTALLETAAY
jgi:2-oxoisovalerate dehydrogenase E1 component